LFMGLWPGTNWGEDSEGTNGIGTCLVEQRPVTIHRDQHFLTRNTLLSCTTAPVHDHEGRLVAALDVSSCRADLTEGFLHLITMATNDAAARIILIFPVADKGPRASLLAVDSGDLVIGATHAAPGRDMASPAPIERSRDGGLIQINVTIPWQTIIPHQQ
jgi:transcriptional regulator of acetoin/glycerol metabolism